MLNKPFEIIYKKYKKTKKKTQKQNTPEIMKNRNRTNRRDDGFRETESRDARKYSSAAYSEAPARAQQPSYSIFSLFFTSFVIRISSVVLIQTSFNPDEYWQSIEIAHSLVFGFVDKGFLPLPKQRRNNNNKIEKIEKIEKKKATDF